MGSEKWGHPPKLFTTITLLHLKHRQYDNPKENQRPYMTEALEYSAHLRRPHAMQEQFLNSTAKRIVIRADRRGGNMVMETIRTVDPTVPVKLVHASRGKAVRAEPIAALAEGGREHHVGVFPELEAEMTTWAPGDSWSPNRMDAKVWALSELTQKRGSTRPKVHR